ncbi:MAG: mechanosensitive ion channel family protein [Bacteroidales bacterium]|nr:mechanosensitive ion channel family protein [Bacteroidales bacterium]
MFHSFDPVIAVREFLANLGIPPGAVSWLSTVILVAGVVLLAWLSFVVTRRILISIFSRIVKRSRSVYDDKFLETRMFMRLAMIVPGVIVWYLAGWMLRENPGWLNFIHKSTALYIVIFASLTLTAFLEGWHRIWLMQPISRGRSIKPYVQLIKVLIIFAGILIMISIIFRIKLTNVVAGLGVATAVLAVVFKDTLLGLVASIQLSSNNMVKLGDWITIPGRNIDGTVIDMTLYTVKIENFDKTILTVPTYALISESFQNWKGMEDSGARRIKREIRIDVRSITFLTPQLIDLLTGMQFMEKWLSANKEEIEAVKRGDPGRITNLGAFRAYMVEYLRNHPDIDNRFTMMVRDMPPTDTGLPVEIYCFSRINSWVPYEAVQSSVVDYAYAVADRFGLKLFQSPSGSDLEALKSITNQKQKI